MKLKGFDNDIKLIDNEILKLKNDIIENKTDEYNLIKELNDDVPDEEYFDEDLIR